MKKKRIFYQVLFISLIIFNGCKKSKPVADFTFTGNVLNPTAEVHFICTYAAGNSYIWDFGDGSPSSNLPNPVHTYTTKNLYKVTLTVTNSGGTDQITKNVEITDNPNSTAPTIEFLPNVTSITKSAGEIILFTVVLNSSAGSQLSKLDITCKYGSSASTNLKSLNLSGTSQNYAFVDTVPFGISIINYSFIVRDNKSKTTTQDFVVNVTTPNTWGTITTTPNISMDNEFVASGTSFWGLSLLSAPVNQATAKQSANKIDFVFGHRSTINGGAFLATPNSNDAKIVYDNSGIDKLSTWNVLNKTLFKLTTLTAAQFDQCTNDSMIQAQTAVGVNNDSYKTVKPNAVVAFITSGGKRGLIKIKSVDGSFETQTGGTVNFDVKVAD